MFDLIRSSYEHSFSRFGAVMEGVHPRENTFKVDLSNFPERPKYEEIHDFIHDTLGLQHHQVKRLQVNHAQKCVYVKCVDLKTAHRSVTEHDGRHQLEVGGKKYAVRLTMDDGSIEVKLHDLSESVNNDDIEAFLHHYGDVYGIKELLWSNNFAFRRAPSGVRVVTMKLHKHINSFVTVKGERSLVTYKNQPKFCRHCTQPLHIGTTCVKNKQLMKQKSNTENERSRTSSVCSSKSSRSSSNNRNDAPDNSNYTSVLEKSSSTQQRETNTSNNSNGSNNQIQAMTSKSKTITQQKQPLQHHKQTPSKRSGNRSSSTPVTSPPRKKQGIADEEPMGATTPVAVADESATDDNEMETVDDDEDQSEPDRKNVMLWLEWREKKLASMINKNPG